MKSGGLLGCLVVSFCLTTGQGWAGGASSPEIGRVSVIVGSVQYHSPTAEWSDALVNEPVAAGTGLRAVSDAEAELRLPGAAIALAPSSELNILRLDRDVLEVAVLQGRVGIHLERSDGAKTVEIDLPQGGVWLKSPGDYDIVAADSQNPARIEVIAGMAELGGGLDESHLVAAAPDLFSEWWRSQDDDRAAANIPKMPSDIVGAAALDAAGRWETDVRYGAVWYPSGVADDWVPYRDGAWRFLPPWGWTWIDNAAWGFAPSHYGRWARIGERWAWAPGPRTDDLGYSYSPAMVAFLGTAGIGLSRPGDNGPAVAWFPLAPGETIGDGDDANYQNRRFATPVPRAVFASGRPIASALLDDLPEQRLADAPVILQSLDIPPVKPGMMAAVSKRLTTIVVAMKKRILTPLASLQRPLVVHLRGAPAHDTRKRFAIAAATPMRPRVLSSTNAPHSTHNRQHLAAVRGGA